MAGAHAAEEPPQTPAPAERRKPHGRRRADPPLTEPDNLATESLPILDQLSNEGKARHRGKPAQFAGKRLGTFAVGSVTGAIMLIQMGITPTATQPAAAGQQHHNHTGHNTIVADPAVILHQEKPEVATEHVLAPAVVEIAPVPEEAAPPSPVVPPPAQAPVLRAPAPAAAPPPAPAPPPPPAYAPASSKAAQIAAAARAQIDRQQDCTMLVTNALASVGIRFHDWPAGYLSLGPTVAPGDAIPGDLLYYAQNGSAVPHIAVYIGNGRAIHGGWNGNQTVEWSVNVGWPAYPPTAYIRVA